MSVPLTAVGWAMAGVGFAALPGHDQSLHRLTWLLSHRALGVTTAESAVRAGRARLLPGSIRLPARMPRSTGTLVVAALTAAGWLLAGPVPGLLTGVTSVVLGWCISVLRAERAADRGRRDLALAAAALSDEYASGATLAGAFAAAASSAGCYESVFRSAAIAADRGEAIPPALTAAAAPPGLDGLAVALGVAERGGVTLTAVLQGVRADLEADQSCRRAVGRALTGPRASGLLLCLLPTVGLTMGAALGADPRSTLLNTPIGLGALVAGVTLDLAGIVITLLLTRRAQP